MTEPDLQEAMDRLADPHASFHCRRKDGAFHVYAERLFVQERICTMAVDGEGSEALRESRYRGEAIVAVLHAAQLVLRDKFVEEALEKERATGQLLVAVMGLLEGGEVDEAAALIESKLMKIYGARHMWPRTLGGT